MRVIFIFALLGLLPASVAATDASTYRWQVLWDKQASLTATVSGARYERQLISVHNSFWADVYDKCSAEAIKAQIYEFRAVAVIDKNGQVTDFVLMPNDNSLHCFVKEMVGRKYPAPPVAPFYEGFTLKMSDE